MNWHGAFPVTPGLRLIAAWGVGVGFAVWSARNTKLFLNCGCYMPARLPVNIASTRASQSCFEFMRHSPFTGSNDGQGD